jgi:hypothetical protein
MKINISFFFIFGLSLFFSFNSKGQITTQEIKQRNNILKIEAFDQPYLSDIDGDNDLDLLTTQDVDDKTYLFIHKNDGKGNYGQAVQTSIEQNQYSLFYFLDINGDNAQDILSSSTSSQAPLESTVYLNDGNGNFTIYQTGIPAGFHAVHDLNKDGKDDFIAGKIIEYSHNYFTHMVWYFYYNDHDNSQQFIEQPIDTFLISHNLSAYDIKSIILEDFDHNGFHDILLVGRQIGKIPGDGLGTGEITQDAALFLNDSNKTLTWSDELVAYEYGVEWGHYQGYAADFNGDGHIDIMRGDQYNGSEDDDSSKIVLYFNNGKGEFSRQNTPVFFEKLHHPQYAVFDVDNDGDPDIVYNGSVREEIKPEYVNQYGTQLLMVYINDGKGNFSYLPSYNLVGGSSGSNKLTTGDVDGDGYQDIITEDYSIGQTILSIFRNEGGNGFKYFYDDSIYACSYSAVLVEDLDNDKFLDIFHKTPYLINKQGEAFSYPSRDEFCNENAIYEALIDYNGDGRKEHVSFEGSQWSPDKYLYLDSNYTSGILSSIKSRYSALSNIEGEAIMLSSGKINQNNQEDIIYVTGDMKVKMAEYDSQSNDFIITDLFTITGLTEIKEFQLINFDYDQLLIIWGTDPNSSQDNILVYNNINGNFEKNTGYVPLINENNKYLNKCEVRDMYSVAEYLFTNSSNEKGLKSYDYSGDYGTEYNEFNGQEVHHAVIGNFSNDNYNKWIAVLYRDPNDNQVKVALSYESTIYNIDEINQIFSFEETSDWGPTSVIGSLQTIDIGNDGTTELIVNSASKDGTSQLKIFEIRLNPITGTPYVKKDGFTIYPNPAVEYVNVSLEKSVEMLTVEVENLDGKTLSSQKFNNTDVASISLNHLSSGCYIINVISSQKTFSKKIVKK